MIELESLKKKNPENQMSLTSTDSAEHALKRKSLKVKCPTCKRDISIQVPLEIKNIGQGGLVNVLIPREATSCGHAMQVFLDMNFRIRGYTRIDYVSDAGASWKLSKPETPAKMEEKKVMKALKIEPEKDIFLSEKEREIGARLTEVIRNFTTSISEVKAIACFDYDGNVFAKALDQSIKLEDISVLSASMLTQSIMLAGGLNMKEVEDFTITSKEYKASVLKAGELLLLIYYSRKIKPGYINFWIKKVVGEIAKLSQELIQERAMNSK
ncbi:MAG: hypothetical protein ACTSVI_06955 [Promethearchaeota archaeon]